MNISSKVFILILLLLASVLVILEMMAGVSYIICLAIAALFGISWAFLMRYGIIKIEGVEIKK